MVKAIINKDKDMKEKIEMSNTKMEMLIKELLEISEEKEELIIEFKKGNSGLISALKVQGLIEARLKKDKRVLKQIITAWES